MFFVSGTDLSPALDVRLYEPAVKTLRYAWVLADTDSAAVAIAQRFGPGAVDGKIQAHIVAVER